MWQERRNKEWLGGETTEKCNKKQTDEMNKGEKKNE
jgi:hypothetical protein